MSMGWEDVSELRPLGGLVFIPQIYDYGEARCNGTDRGKPKSQCHFVHYKSYVDWPGHEPWPLVRALRLTTWAITWPLCIPCNDMPNSVQIISVVSEKERYLHFVQTKHKNDALQIAYSLRSAFAVMQKCLSVAYNFNRPNNWTECLNYVHAL